MLNLEVSIVKGKSHPRLKLTLPKLSSETIIVSNPKIPKASVLINLQNFKINQSSMEYFIDLDEMEIDMNSSAIEFVNYLPTEQALIVKFWNSACYVYYNIPEALYAFLVVAESKGKVYHQLIQNKYKSKIIPEDFTVDNVKEVVSQELEEGDINFEFNISLIDLDSKALNQMFSHAKSTKEKMAILSSPNFTKKDHIDEICADFWLATTALQKGLVNEDEKNQILKKQKFHQYYSSPNNKIKNEKKTLLLVPQYQMFSTHISGLDTIPQLISEEVSEKVKLKKGMALMEKDEMGNLSLVKYRLAY